MLAENSVSLRGLVQYINSLSHVRVFRSDAAAIGAFHFPICNLQMRSFDFGVETSTSAGK